VEPFQPTVNAPHLCQTVHQDLQDLLDLVVNPDNPEAPANPEMTDPQAKLLPLAHHKIPRASHVLRALPDPLERMDKPDHQDQMDSPAPQDKVVAKDLQDLKDLPAILAQAVNQEHPDNLEAQDKMELAQPHLQDPRDLQEDQDLLDHPDQTETQDNPEAKDNPDPLDQTAIQDNQEAMDSLDKREEMACPDPMQPTVLAHLVHPSLCTVNRLAQPCELHRTTAILFICLLFVEKMKKDCLFQMVKK